MKERRIKGAEARLREEGSGNSEEVTINPSSVTYGDTFPARGKALLVRNEREEN